MNPILKVVNLSKQIGSLSTLNRISFEVNPGEIFGLAGWAGAGKSVLAAILAGIQNPDEGEMYFDNKRMKWPFNSRSFGFEVIHQEPRIIETLDICSNIFLGHELSFPQWQNNRLITAQRQMEEIATEILKKMDVSLPFLHDNITSLSIEYRQIIAIARAMIMPARLILIDDTAALLGFHYQQRLLNLIREWRHKGITIIFSSNNLDHLFNITDRIAVLREGSLVSIYDTDEVTRELLVGDLVGTTDRQQITPLVWALESYNLARERAEVLRDNQVLLERELVSKDSVNTKLLQQLNKQVLALDKANQALQDAQRRLISSREDERKIIARELHDKTVQDLLRLNYQLERIEETEMEPAIVSKQVNAIRSEVRRLIVEIRGMCTDLRPPSIDYLGLGSAITSYVQDWEERTHIRVKLQLGQNLVRLPEEIELSIFRIIQESLANTEKHSKAKNVEIKLKHPNPRSLFITFADDGIGLSKNFDLSTLSAQKHYGLLGITERVALLGGHLKIHNQASGGALIQIEIPHPRASLKNSQLVDI